MYKGFILDDKNKYIWLSIENLWNYLIDIMNMNVIVLENFFEKGDFDYGIEWISFLICFLVFLVICFVGFVGNIMFIRIFVGKI